MYRHMRKNPKNGFTEYLYSDMRYIKGWKRIK
jgi:hypothetical protein